MLPRSSIAILLLAALAGCATPTARPVATASYANPVLDTDFPDPSVIRAPDRSYYAYATQTQRGGKWVNIQAARSADLVHWQLLGDALPAKPAWASKTQDFWAPDVIRDGARYIMEVGRLAEEGDLHIVAALVAALADVERLVEVADQVDDEAKRQLLVGEVGLRVLQHHAKMVERLKRVTRGRRMVVGDSVQRHIVPGRRSLLPEDCGVRAHFVGPVGCVIEAFARSKDLAHVRSG